MNAKVMVPFSVVPYTSAGCLMLLKVTSFTQAHGVYAAGGCSEEHLVLEMTIAHSSELNEEGNKRHRIFILDFGQ